MSSSGESDSELNVIHRRRIGGCANALTISVAACLLGLPRLAASQDAIAARLLELHPCAAPPNDGPAQCGTYQVFEDRVAKTGRKLALRMVVLPALGPKRAADAVFYLAGGPGGAATASVGAAKFAFLAPLRADHDIVFVDQRGTGHSNPLDCDLGDDANNLDVYFGKLMPLPLVRACRAKLAPKANLKLYTTSIAMDDLDEVRAALGYERIDLVAVSYGTIAAQVYVRQHGDHVRAAFLAGVATPGIKQPLLFARAAQAALDSMYVDCAAELACRAAFPNIKSEFAAVLARFDHGPITVSMRDPSTGATLPVKLERENYVERLRLMLYTTSTARLVPIVVHRAFGGDFMPFEQIARGYNLGATLSRGMYMTVTCSEGVPFISDRERDDETRGTFVGDTRIQRHQAACDEWPRGDVAAAFIEPLRTNVPILMFSGGVDGSTPPWLGKDALKFLAHGRQINARYYGHQLDHRCVWDVLHQFIETASVDAIDASCAGRIRRPAFATDYPPKSE
jgi:pimeloyl-ACP methyl ester carboxylesterase